MFKFLQFGNKIRTLFQKKVDEQMLSELEQLFFEADLGTELSMQLSDTVRSLAKTKPSLPAKELLHTLQEDLVAQIPSYTAPPHHQSPYVILVVGVNGNGKTTTIAKLAKHYKDQGKKVLIGSADTFRAAAQEQLEVWTSRIGVDLVRGKMGSDPAAVVFDSIQAGQKRNCDIVLIDTAGRLHTKNDLMHELQKIHRVISKAHPSAPHETLLVLDATVGQNGVEQARIFHQFTPLTGLVLTKCDGTARGGGALAIQKKLGIPIRFLGFGEKIDDIRPFSPSQFVKSLFE